ncbi:MAG TPA: hypothetical protein VNS12_13705 [Pelagibacterium sp.]|uniref:hypothetical protein n=1 Tax=Pelagibacterium sp. TaxID=1967288 RepID=UPI002CC0A394|nr:hypothetical protein [Pelagibacterium sp.]HWJ89118.1 hypothetical protein [Pelagibacterium sp.]
MSKVRKLNIHNIKNRFLRGIVMWAALPLALIVLVVPLVLAESAYEAARVFGQRLREVVWRDLIKSNFQTLLFRRVAA